VVLGIALMRKWGMEEGRVYLWLLIHALPGEGQDLHLTSGEADVFVASHVDAIVLK
jgi:hypothetical protein